METTPSRPCLLAPRDGSDKQFHATYQRRYVKPRPGPRSAQGHLEELRVKVTPVDAPHHESEAVEWEIRDLQGNYVMAVVFDGDWAAWLHPGQAPDPA